jgi:hypothetical protein
MVSLLLEHGRAVPHGPNERVFIVRAPNGREQEVVVEITPMRTSSVGKKLQANCLLLTASGLEQASSS